MFFTAARMSSLNWLVGKSSNRIGKLSTQCSSPDSLIAFLPLTGLRSNLAQPLHVVGVPLTHAVSSVRANATVTVNRTTSGFLSTVSSTSDLLSLKVPYGV
ncbi:MAG: hypothetical protein BWX66_01282 [Deltaproteobacteria bacterium ADurb.Bin058]|nr:MAG: hypothetical protein BWX66_01282 [Deltaproteobacteria bacterium ADurb.Bin058]